MGVNIADVTPFFKKTYPKYIFDISYAMSKRKKKKTNFNAHLSKILFVLIKSSIFCILCIFKKKKNVYFNICI